MASPTSNTGGAGRVHHLDPLAKTQVQKKTEKKLEKDVEKVDNARQSIHEGEGEKKSEIKGETSLAQFPATQTEHPEVGHLKEKVVKGKADAHIPRKLERQEAKGNLYGATQKEDATSTKESAEADTTPKESAAPATKQRAPMTREQKLAKQSRKKRLDILDPQLQVIRTQNKEEHEAKLEATKKEINHFLGEMKLAHVPKVGIGFRDLKATTGILSAATNKPDAPSVPTDSTIGKALHSMEPYYHIQNKVQAFSAAHTQAFQDYVATLPDKSEVDKLQEAYDKFQKSCNNPATVQEKAILREMRGKLKETEKKVKLKQKIGGHQLQAFLFKPLFHLREYNQRLGEFNEYLGKAKPDVIKQKSEELLQSEKDFTEALEVLTEVLDDKSFLDKLAPKEEEKKKAHKKGEAEQTDDIAFALTLRDLAKTIKTEVDQTTLPLFEGFKNSVHNNPEGWIEALPK